MDKIRNNLFREAFTQISTNFETQTILTGTPFIPEPFNQLLSNHIIKLKRRKKDAINVIFNSSLSSHCQNNPESAEVSANKKWISVFDFLETHY